MVLSSGIAGKLAMYRDHAAPIDGSAALAAGKGTQQHSCATVCRYRCGQPSPSASCPRVLAACKPAPHSLSASFILDSTRLSVDPHFRADGQTRLLLQQQRWWRRPA